MAADCAAGACTSGLFGFRGLGLYSRLRNWTDNENEDDPLGELPWAVDNAKCGNDQDSSLDVVAVRVLARCRPCFSNEGCFHITADSSGPEAARFSLQAPGIVVQDILCNAYFGADVEQETVFQHAMHIVDQSVEGCNGIVVCCGGSGSGKSYTLVGEFQLEDQQLDTIGLIQRASRVLFERTLTRDEVFIVEASYLAVCYAHKEQERLVDLLSTDDQQLRLAQDPFAPAGMIVEGLSRTPIRRYEKVNELLQAGLHRHNLLFASRPDGHPKSHGVFTLHLQGLAVQDGLAEPIVTRATLTFLEFAGNGGLAPQLGFPAGQRRSITLEKLLHTSFSGNSNVLVIANFSPSVAEAAQSLSTLAFAQEVMLGKGAATGMDAATGETATVVPQAAAAAAAAAGVPSSGPTVDSQAAVPSAVVETQEPRRLRGPLLTQPGSPLLAKTAQERAEATLDNQQLQAISKQAAMGEMHGEVVPVKPASFDPGRTDPPELPDESRVNDLTEQMQEAQACCKAAELELATIKVRLAQSEQRIQLLVEEQDELARDKTTLDEERRGLRQQTDTQRQRLIIFQADIERYRIEAEGQNMLIGQLTDAQSADYESTCHERSNWRSHETELQQKAAKLRRQLEDFRRRGKVEQVRAATIRCEESSQLQLRVQRLQDQAAVDAARVEEALNLQKELEIEWPRVEAREKALQQELARKRLNMSKAMEETRAREEELHEMLHELQEGLLQEDSDDGQPVLDHYLDA